MRDSLTGRKDKLLHDIRMWGALSSSTGLSVIFAGQHSRSFRDLENPATTISKTGSTRHPKPFTPCKMILQLWLPAAAGEKYDLTWLRDVDLPHIQYQSSDSSKLHYFVDNSNEGGAYTQFIYDYYDCLPKVRRIPQNGSREGHSQCLSCGNNSWPLEPLIKVL